MAVVRAYTLAPREIEEFGRLNEEHLARVLRQTRTHGLFSPLLAIMAGIGALGVLWIGGRAVLEGRLSLGVLVAFSGVRRVPRLADDGARLGAGDRPAGARGVRAGDRDPPHAPGIVDGPEAAALREPVRGEIEIRRLTFSYAPDRPPALRDLSLRIEAGRSVAIVGPTGAGKTTLAALLPRLWDPPPGTVFIDGAEIHAIPLRDLRAAIGVVPQEAFLFSRTLRENVAFGAAEAGVPAAAEVAGLIARRGPALRRLGDGGRRARAHAVRRAAPAGDPRARPSPRPENPRAGRRVRGGGRGDGGDDPRAPARRGSASARRS